MSYTILQLKQDLTGIIHGTTLNQVQNLDGIIDRGGRQVLMDVDPQETKRITQLTPLFDQVYDYAAPTDLKGNRVIDIRPQVHRTTQDIFLQSYNQDFDVQKQFLLQDQFTINFNNGIKSLRINAPFLQNAITVNNATGVTDNGTFTGGGGATNLSTDFVNYAVYSSSLEFDLSLGQPTGYVENSTMESQDLSSHLNQSTLFMYAFLPDADDVIAIELRWGSSATDYWVLSTSVTQQNTVFQNGWNLLAFPWASATMVGTPDDSSVGYVRVTFSYDSTLQTGVHINGITSILGTIYEIEYYSKFIFRDGITGAFQERVTDDSNIVNLDTETCNLLLNQVALLVAQQLQGSNALAFDYQFFQKLYTECLTRYKAMYKSEIQKPQQIYYQQPRPIYGNWLGRNISNW